MATELVTRLRFAIPQTYQQGDDGYDLLREAADEIERLEKRLVEALSIIKGRQVSMERMRQKVRDLYAENVRLEKELASASSPATIDSSNVILTGESLPHCKTCSCGAEVRSLPYPQRRALAMNANPGDVWMSRKTGRTATVVSRERGNLQIRHQTGKVTHKWAPYFAQEFDPCTMERGTSCDQ